ncbi:MAG: hypothetical protein V4677_03440 [Bacteroidota bacterium]
MKSSPQIEIKRPCFVKLESTGSDERGKFCPVCQTSVVDFTNKTPDEITSYFQTHSIKNTCGTFNSWDVKHERKVDQLISYLQHKKLKFLAVFIIGILVLTGCRIRRQGAPAYGQNGKYLESDTTASISPPTQKSPMN